MQNTLNAFDELRSIRQERGESKPGRKTRSKLEPYTHDLIPLRTAGATYSELVYWLRTRHQLDVSLSTVCHFLKKKQQTDTNTPASQPE